MKKPEKIDSKNLIHVVVIIARINPGESPASFVCQGFLEYLTIANHPISRTLREHVVFKIIPMLNPDGVFLGNNRCNLIGHDLNRSWDHISSYTHPTLQAAFNILKELDTSSVIHIYFIYFFNFQYVIMVLFQCYQIDFIIDIHAHSTLTGTFIYGSTFDDVYRYERHLVFPKLFSTKCEDFSLDNMMFNADDKKSGTARRFFCENLSDSINAYSLEVSMCGYYLDGNSILTQYTEDGC